MSLPARFMIDLYPNETLLWQWLLFMGALVTLTWGVFRPALGLLDARKDKIDGELGRAGKFRSEAAGLVSVCESRLATARQQGSAGKQSLREEGERRQAEILSTARLEVQGALDRVRGEIESASREASMRLRQYSQELAKMIASKVLEREV